MTDDQGSPLRQRPALVWAEAYRWLCTQRKKRTANACTSHLRRAIRKLSEFFDLSRFERHPDKTQAGRISRGFNWLGIWFSADRASPVY